MKTLEHYDAPDEEDICHVTHVYDKAVKSDSSFFVNWEIASTLPRSRGKEVSLDRVPYVSRLKYN